MRARRTAALALATLLVSGCDAATEDPASGSASDAMALSRAAGPGAGTDPALVLDDVSAEPTWPVPAGAPAHFGFGGEASAERVARWDHDVRPDGTGLPPGRGSVGEGAVVYREKCSACHGATGTEGPNDRLVGRDPREGFPFGADRSAGPRTVGNYWPYATTLYDYVTRAMPQNVPGSLTADETYAVIAWILARNEIVPEDAVLDAGSLAALRMPAADRFVPDDRRGGAEIR